MEEFTVLCNETVHLTTAERLPGHDLSHNGNGTTVSLRARLPFQRELNQNIFLYDNLRVKREPKTLIFCDSDDESSRITSTIQLHLRVFLLHSIVSTLPGKMQVSADTGSDHEETGTAFALAEWVPPSKRIERPV